jgi:septum formation protein
VTRVLLASTSPRRHALIGALVTPAGIVDPDVDETFGADEGTIAAVRRVATAKASAPEVADDVTVVAADTVVVATDGHRLGKPEDRAHARDLLRAVSGSSVAVLTGVAVRRGHDVRSFVVTSWLHLHRFGDHDIERYLDTG